MNLTELLNEKRKSILSGCQKHGANNVRIFGSYVKGNQKSNSDVDILIDLDSSKLPGWQYYGVIQEIEEELEEVLGVKVHVVDEVGLKDSIREEILSEARSI